MMMRRRSDRPRLVGTALGIGLVLFAVGLRVWHVVGDDWLVFGLAVLGAGMVNPTYVVDLVSAWRGTRRRPEDEEDRP